MQITEMPADFSPAYSDIIYEVETEPGEENFIAGFYDREGAVKYGEKLLEEPGTHRINASAYAKALVNVAPMPYGGSSAAITGQRLAFVWLERAYKEVPHTGGKYGCKPGGMLSDAPLSREICPGEQDEISFITDANVAVQALFHAPDGGSASVLIGSVVTGGHRNYVTVAVNFDHLCQALAAEGKTMEDYNRFTVDVGNGTKVEYRIGRRVPQSVRVCWHNVYGGVDYFTFPALVERKAVKGRDGKWKHEECVATPAMTRDKAQWLSQLASAYNVWKVEGEEFIPVEIAADKMAVYGEELSGIEVKLICGV